MTWPKCGYFQMRISATLPCNKQTIQEPLLEILAALFDKQTTQELLLELLATLFKIRSHLDIKRLIFLENSIPLPYSDSVTDSLLLQNDLLAPPLINLETSGLRRSSRIAALNYDNDVPAIAAYTNSTMPIPSRQITRPRPRLSYLSVFNLIGSLWTFATTTSQTDLGNFSFAARFSNDYDHLNGLFDDTINDICHQIHAYATSNESFTYS